MINDLYTLIYWRESWFLTLIALPLILVVFNSIRQQWQWNKLANESLQPWLKVNNKSSKTITSIVSLSLAWFCFVIALAGPRLVDYLPPEQQAQPASLIIVIDLSASMNAQDAYPSRKQQAIQWLTQSVHNKPDHLKIGLVLFAGHAFNLMPATLDKNVIEHFIEQLNNLPLPTLGNDLTAALNIAKQQFTPQDAEQHIAILSDGDLSKDEQKRAQAFIQNELHNQSISFIGFGANKAVKLPKNNDGFVLFNGRPVLSRLQSAWLNQIANFKHVSYQRYEQIKQQNLKQTILLKAARLNQQAQQHAIWHELFPYPLALALFFLLMSIWRLNFSSNETKCSLQIILCGFMMIGLISHSSSSQASNSSVFKEANNALNAEKYKLAQSLFNQIDSARSAYGEGIACYRQNDFKCAIRAFSKASWQADNDKIRANAVFNLGNSYFFVGEYEQASVLFKDAENLGFNSKIAINNLEFSNVMQQAVLQRIKDIKEIFRRAKWRAAVSGNPSPSLNNIISTQNNLAIKSEEKTRLFLMRQAIAQQANKKLGLQLANGNTSTKWIKTEHIANQSSAQLLKRLLEMELSLPASLKEPQAIEGKRRW